MRSRILTLMTAAAIALSGCGGNDDDEPGRTETVPAGGAIEVIGDEYSFDPETLIFDTGGTEQELRITLRNEGRLAHNLRVYRGDEDIGGTPTFRGGEVRDGTVTVAPGTYQLICTVGNHAQLGMTGTLEVR